MISLYPPPHSILPRWSHWLPVTPPPPLPFPILVSPSPPQVLLRVTLLPPPFPPFPLPASNLYLVAPTIALGPVSPTAAPPPRRDPEYGRAIHCDATNSGSQRGGGAAEGDTGPTAMVGATRYRLEAGKGKGVKSGGNSGTRGSTCGGEGETRIRNGNGGGGVTGGQWLQRGKMERGG